MQEVCKILSVFSVAQESCAKLLCPNMGSVPSSGGRFLCVDGSPLAQHPSEGTSEKESAPSHIFDFKKKTKTTYIIKMLHWAKFAWSLLCLLTIFLTGISPEVPAGDICYPRWFVKETPPKVVISGAAHIQSPRVGKDWYQERHMAEKQKNGHVIVLSLGICPLTPIWLGIHTINLSKNSLSENGWWNPNIEHFTCWL